MVYGNFPRLYSAHCLQSPPFTPTSPVYFVLEPTDDGYDEIASHGRISPENVSLTVGNDLPHLSPQCARLLKDVFGPTFVCNASSAFLFENRIKECLKLLTDIEQTIVHDEYFWDSDTELACYLQAADSLGLRDAPTKDGLAVPQFFQCGHWNTILNTAVSKLRAPAIKSYILGLPNSNASSGPIYQATTNRHANDTLRQLILDEILCIISGEAEQLTYLPKVFKRNHFTLYPGDLRNGATFDEVHIVKFYPHIPDAVREYLRSIEVNTIADYVKAFQTTPPPKRHIPSAVQEDIKRQFLFHTLNGRYYSDDSCFLLQDGRLISTFGYITNDNGLSLEETARDVLDSVLLNPSLNPNQGHTILTMDYLSYPLRLWLLDNGWWYENDIREAYNEISYALGCEGDKQALASEYNIIFHQKETSAAPSLLVCSVPPFSCLDTDSQKALYGCSTLKDYLSVVSPLGGLFLRTYTDALCDVVLNTIVQTIQDMDKED